MFSPPTGDGEGSEQHHEDMNLHHVHHPLHHSDDHHVSPHSHDVSLQQDQQDADELNLMMVENLMHFSPHPVIPYPMPDGTDVDDALHHLHPPPPQPQIEEEPISIHQSQPEPQLQLQPRPQQHQDPPAPPKNPSRKRKTHYSQAKAVAKPFNDRLFELMLFKAHHGHCKIPNGHPLKPWAMYITQQKRAMDDGEDPTKIISERILRGTNNDNLLNLERIQVLTEAGFEWSRAGPKVLEQAWMARFQELQEYRAQHGTCITLPTTHPTLTKWCNNQRYAKKIADQIATGEILQPHTKFTKVTPLKPERIDLLNSIGFPWRLGPDAIGWENRFQQLIQYKAEHGNCDVPQEWKQDRAFGRWVMKQRHEHSLKLRGLASQLTDEREHRLNALGMNWVAPGFRKKSVPEFDARHLGGEDPSTLDLSNVYDDTMLR